MEATVNSAANKEFQVTGISRSGRVRKKSSKLLDFQSPDEVEKKLKRAPKPPPRNGALRGRSQTGNRLTARKQPPSVSGTTGLSATAHDMAPDDDELHDDMEANTTTDGEHFDDDGVDDVLPTGDSDEDLKELYAGIVDGEPIDSAGNPDSKVRSSLYMTEKANKRRVLKDGRVITGKAERKDKGKTRYTAYSMWARELRKNGKLSRTQDLDFSNTAKRLGELWANVSNKEKNIWRRKAKIQATKAKSRERVLTVGNNATSTPYMSYFKPTTSRTKKLAAERDKSPPITPVATAVKPRTHRSSTSIAPAANTLSEMATTTKRKRNNSHNRLNSSSSTGTNAAIATVTGTALVNSNFSNNNLISNTHTSSTYANAHSVHKKASLPNIEPVDAAAHLKLLGESLTIIGERLKEHEGQIAVSGSLSVLLDSLLCSLGPLLCLTTRIPGLERKLQLSENLAATLDNIAYVMPGL